MTGYTSRETKLVVTISGLTTDTKCIKQISEKQECENETRTECYDMERESSSNPRARKFHQNIAEEASMRHIAQVNGVLCYRYDHQLHFAC